MRSKWRFLLHGSERKKGKGGEDVFALLFSGQENEIEKNEESEKKVSFHFFFLLLLLFRWSSLWSINY